MKNRTQLLIGILGLSVLFGLPVVAQSNQLEDSFSGLPSSPTESGLDSVNPSVGYEKMPDASVDAASPKGNLVEQVTSSTQFQTLAQAIEAAGIGEALAEEGPYTVFAPTDEAFAALPPEVLQQLLQPENRDVLVQLLSYHVVAGAVTSDQIESGEIETLAGEVVAVQLNDDGTVTVNNATVTQANIPASNGIIHEVDQVILPPQAQAQLEAAPDAN